MKKSSLRAQLKPTSLLTIILLLASGFQLANAQPSGETTVFHENGKNRVHIDGCRRLSDDPAVRATMTTMTLAEAEAKGLPPCSRCPGSETPGLGTPESNSGPESWVNPPPDEIAQYPFEPSKYAPLISMGNDGKLVYRPYSKEGDQVMDWSHCGYKNSVVPIPNVPVFETLEPLPGGTTSNGTMAYPKGPDSRGRIQAAIDRVAAMSPDPDGMLGAVLLKKGTYYLDGGLNVLSGVVLRGEGDGEGGTILLMNSAEGGGNAIELGAPNGKVNSSDENNSVRIADEYVPSGSLELTLTDASSFKVGDYVYVRKTVNDQWIEDLGMGERLRHIRGGKEGEKKKPWKPESYQFRHLRQIVSIDGNTITLDAILPQSFDQQHGSGGVYTVEVDSLATHSGVESLQIVSNYDTSIKDTGKEANFRNFRSGIVIKAAYDSWVRDCTVKHVSFAAVAIGGDTRQITVRDSKNLEPVGPKRGGNRYAFSIGGGTLHLFYNCYSEDGRHDFAIGSRETGPFAFVNCTAVRGGQSEPHHRWSTGILYDNVVTKDGTLAAINRGDSGSGHGWAAANTMFWNCDAKSIVVFNPETSGENNFAIGYTGEILEEYDTQGLWYANTRAGYWGTPAEGKYYGFALMGSGYIESPGGPVEPASLFTQQLIDRIGKKQAAEVLK